MTFWDSFFDGLLIDFCFQLGPIGFQKNVNTHEETHARDKNAIKHMKRHANEIKSISN